MLSTDYGFPACPSEGAVIKLSRLGTACQSAADRQWHEYPEDQRREIIRLAQSGHPQRYIGSLVGRPLKTVNRIIQAFKYEGRVRDAPRPPPPRVTTEDEDACIIASVVQDPFQSARAIRHTLDLDVSDSTVRRRLRSAGLRSRIASQKPLLTTSNKNARLHFATQHASWRTEDWGRVIFSDESTFCTRLDQSVRVWRLQGFR
ncbi:hypothetical protein HPB48_005442 [Haemaphysalis longicornis]|uniref:Transposase Tc1-like domain-containing protein n=1 Tax=Haemaphysalis longicornis TaxID=44386 RepID=A0A9J6G3V7_HAELO|nr:hypothetical protein HPB48_005442 [Haemaphysalis longicornis]